MLHTVNKSPFERNAFKACLARAKEGSVIVLFEDAVYAVTRGTTLEKIAVRAAEKFHVFVLGPDLNARGYDWGQVVEGVTVVDYDDFVDIVVTHGPVTAWL